MISLKSRSVPVVGVAICLDDQSRRRPVEVDQMSLDQDVDLRERQASLLAEGEEVDLERRDGVCRSWIDPSGNAPKSTQSPSSVALFDHPVELAPVEPTAAFGIDDQVFEQP